MRAAGFSVCSFSASLPLVGFAMAAVDLEASCTFDAEKNEWTVIGKVGKPITVKGQKGVEYEAVGNSRPPKWNRANKGNMVPGPRMGASPFTPKAKTQQGRPLRRVSN